MGEVFNMYTTTGGDLHWSDTEFGEHVVKANQKTQSAGVITGWICPVCGRGLSPYTSFCPCKGWVKMEVTC